MKQKLPLYQRLIFAVPVLGWMLKDVVYGDPDNIWYFALTLVSLWGIAILQFGVLGLVLPVLGLVPLLFLTLVLLSRG